jgi:hypothetical protein
MNMLGFHPSPVLPHRIKTKRSLRPFQRLGEQKKYLPQLKNLSNSDAGAGGAK